MNESSTTEKQDRLKTDNKQEDFFAERLAELLLRQVEIINQ